MSNQNSPEMMWQMIMGPMMFAPQEIALVSPAGEEEAWFSASSPDGSTTDKMVIGQADFNQPSVDIKEPFTIGAEEFIKTFPHYEQWKAKQPVEVPEVQEDHIPYIMGLIASCQ